MKRCRIQNAKYASIRYLRSSIHLVQVYLYQVYQVYQVYLYQVFKEQHPPGPEPRFQRSNPQPSSHRAPNQNSLFARPPPEEKIAKNSLFLKRKIEEKLELEEKLCFYFILPAFVLWWLSSNKVLKIRFNKSFRYIFEIINLHPQWCCSRLL